MYFLFLFKNCLIWLEFTEVCFQDSNKQVSIESDHEQATSHYSKECLVYLSIDMTLGLEEWDRFICSYVPRLIHSTLMSMGLIPNTQNCGFRMRRECREPFPRHRLQKKPLVNDPGMHHGMCVTHVPWCMSGSLTRGGGEKIPAFPVHAQPAISRSWQEAHCMWSSHAQYW